MPAVPDASPLIALSKIERVALLAELYGDVLVTPGVWVEAVVNGKALGARDAEYLEKAAAELRFAKVRLTSAEKTLVGRIRQDNGVGLGEAEVLAVSKMRDAIATLDDKSARAIAVGLGVAHVGTVGVLHESFMRGLIGYEELLGLLERVGQVAWVSPDLLARVIRQAAEVSRQWKDG